MPGLLAYTPPVPQKWPPDPIEGTERVELGGVVADVAAIGNHKVRRVTYPPGYRWSTHLKPVVGGDWCQHTHVGFLVSGRVDGVYSDGCEFSHVAPTPVVLLAGHDGWVVGDEVATFVQFDCEGDTAARLDLPDAHRH